MEEITQVLTLNDLCDYCGNSAYVRVITNSGLPLDFCGHDFQKYEAILIKYAYTIIDERGRLLDRSSSLDVWAQGVKERTKK